MSWVPFIIADSNVVKHLVYLSGGLADTIEVQNGLTAIMKDPLINFTNQCLYLLFIRGHADADKFLRFALTLVYHHHAGAA